MQSKRKGSFVLLLAALVWGMAFIFQKNASDTVGAFTFVTARSLISCICLIPICYISDKRATKHYDVKKLLVRGFILGLILATAEFLQQFGLSDTSAGKSGFITALYIVFVPVISVLIGKKLTKSVIIAVVIALIGSALLSLDFSEGFSLGKGEFITFLCAITFAVQIIFIDRYCSDLPSVHLCFMQFLVCIIIGLICAPIFEEIDFSALKANWLSLLYTGVMSGAVGYTLQLIGQKSAPPEAASLTMCMESVFAALGGWLIGGETMALVETLGCVLVFSGCIISQFGDK